MISTEEILRTSTVPVFRVLFVVYREQTASSNQGLCIITLKTAIFLIPSAAVLVMRFASVVHSFNVCAVIINDEGITFT